MPKFQVEIPHALQPDDVRARLDKAKRKLENDYGATCTWEDPERMLVARKGLSARVQIASGCVRVDVDLMFLLSPASGSIRTGITKQLTDLLT